MDDSAPAEEHCRTAPAEDRSTWTAGTSLWRMRTTLREEPGSLAALCTALAEHRIDVLTLHPRPLGATSVDEFLLAVEGAPEAAELAAAVAAAGGRDTWLDPVDPQDLVTPSTRAGGTAPAARDDGDSGARGGGDVRGLGDVPAFPDLRTPHGLRRPQDLRGLRGVTLRDAGPRDLAAAREMHRRCSADTLRARYPGPATDADRYLEHLLTPRFGRSLAAVGPDGRLVALGHLLWDDPETEVTVLVEDAWQGRGLGGLLLARLTALAAESGSTAVYAITPAPNPALVGAMRRLGLALEFRVEDGTLVVSAPLAALTTDERSAGPGRGFLDPFPGLAADPSTP